MRSQHTPLLRIQADQQQALVVVLGIGTPEGAVDSACDRSEGLQALFDQDLLEAVESEFTARFVSGFENTVGGDEQGGARL